MKLCFFPKTASIGPSSRYRIYQYLPYLSAAGIRTQVYPLFGPAYFTMIEVRPKWVQTLVKMAYTILRFLKRVFDILSISPGDLVVIEGQLFPYCPPIVEKMLARRNRFIVELDDAIYLTPWHGRKIPAVLRFSSGAIVGNAMLARYARTHTSTVSVFPTVVDTDRFRPGPVGRASSSMSVDKSITIVWIGLAFNFAYVEMLVPVFQRLQSEYDIVFRVICSRPPLLPDVRMEFRPWTYETEVEDLQKSDIGVMPLIDNEWAQGKCGLKLLQYMAVGLPSVASPVGVNCEIVREGDNGFLAKAAEDWYQHLALLCRDVELRKRVGRSARATVESQYSLNQWGGRLAEHYKTIMAAGSPQRPVTGSHRSWSHTTE